MHQQGTYSEDSFVAMVASFVVCLLYKNALSGKKKSSCKGAFYQQYHDQRTGTSAGTDRQIKTARLEMLRSGKGIIGEYSTWQHCESRYCPQVACSEAKSVSLSHKWSDL